MKFPALTSLATSSTGNPQTTPEGVVCTGIVSDTVPGIKRGRFIPMTKTIVASRKNYTVEMLRTERELPETAIYVNTALDVLNPFPGLTFVPVSIYTDNGKYYGVVQ